jgi:hypothetical protein
MPVQLGPTRIKVWPILAFPSHFWPGAEPDVLPSGTVGRDVRKPYDAARQTGGGAEATTATRRSPCRCRSRYRCPSPPVVDFSPVISLCLPLPSPHSGSCSLALFISRSSRRTCGRGWGRRRRRQPRAPRFSACSSWRSGFHNCWWSHISIYPELLSILSLCLLFLEYLSLCLLTSSVQWRIMVI